MSTSTSADERESVEEVASKEIREADRDETETVDNADDDDDDDENKDSPKNIKTGNSKSKEEEEEEEKEEVVANQEEGAEQEKSQEEPKEETGKSEDNDGVEPKDATAADDGPRFEENDESTTHDSDAASEDTEGPEEGFDEDPANSKVSLGGLVSTFYQNFEVYSRMLSSNSITSFLRTLLCYSWTATLPRLKTWSVRRPYSTTAASPSRSSSTEGTFAGN